MLHRSDEYRYQPLYLCNRSDQVVIAGYNAYELAEPSTDLFYTWVLRTKRY